MNRCAARSTHRRETIRKIAVRDELFVISKAKPGSQQNEYEHSVVHFISQLTTNETMTTQKYHHSTPTRHSSLPSSQLYANGERGSVAARSDIQSSPTTKRRSVPRSASSNSKAREERDSYYPVTPTRESVTIKQSSGSSGKSGASSKSEYTDEFPKKLSRPDMQQISKEHLRKVRKVIEGKDRLVVHLLLYLLSQLEFCEYQTAQI